MSQSILLIEDSRAQLKAVSAILRNDNFMITSAASLREALACLDYTSFDCILLDLSLPDSEGLDTLRSVRSKARSAPLIVLTSTDDAAQVAEALREGAQDYLIKGRIDGELLKRSIRYGIDRARTQELVRQSEEKFRLLVESAKDYAIFMLDTEGNILTWSSGAETITGYSGDEILGKNLSIFYPQSAVDRGEPQHGLREAVLKGRYEDEGWRKRKDGTRYWVNFINTPLYDAEGNLRGYARIARDTTEKRIAEETLRQKIVMEQKMVLVDVLQSVTIAINLAPTVEDAVATLLKEVCMHTKWTMGCGNIVDTESKGECQVSKVWYFPEGSKIRADDSVLRERLLMGVGIAGKSWESGSPVWLDDIANDDSALCVWLSKYQGIKSGLAVPVYEGTRLFAIVEFFAAGEEKPDAPFLEVMANIGKQLTAIVERKRLEQLLAKEMQNLSRSNAELQEFAKIAAHDLQEPLKSVQGFVDLLKRRYSNELGDDGKRFINFIDDAVIRMELLIRGVLDHSKIKSHEKPFELIDLNKVVEEVKNNLSVSIEQTGAIIKSEDLPPVVADQLQMVQLFQNLLANALKFRNPEVVPEIQISWRREGGDYQFSIKDNGIGMDSRYLNKIFGMFSRLNAKTEYPGTGIGLAICKKIVEHHGGAIWAKSQLGKGSELCFILPDESRS
ncbi:MAG: hypothetical protein C0469_02440 [Cyanobacteria bacterium DS2.3.42]|nr:hypothetical protein [Cyanobacteria bacterium DS2.3.42]